LLFGFSLSYYGHWEDTTSVVAAPSVAPTLRVSAGVPSAKAQEERRGSFRSAEALLPRMNAGAPSEAPEIPRIS